MKASTLRTGRVSGDAMTQAITGMITNAGIALAEAPTRQRKRIRRNLHAAIQRVLSGLRCG
jgi:hypothetical protein